MSRAVAKAPLRLHLDAFWISPYSFSAFVALTEKGLPFEVAPLALDKGEHKQGDFPRQSFTGKIPALQHGDFWLAESSAIVEYLDEAFPDGTPLLPKALEDRARARMVMAFVRSDMLALREERPTTTMFYERAKTPLSLTGQIAAERLVSFAEALIEDGKTSLFDTWSVADADLAFMLQRLALNDHRLPATLRAFVDAQWARPSVRAFVTHERAPYQAY